VPATLYTICRQPVTSSGVERVVMVDNRTDKQVICEFIEFIVAFQLFGFRSPKIILIVPVSGSSMMCRLAHFLSFLELSSSSSLRLQQ